jgi:hypothetical protein
MWDIMDTSSNGLPEASLRVPTAIAELQGLRDDFNDTASRLEGQGRLWSLLTGSALTASLLRRDAARLDEDAGNLGKGDIPSVRARLSDMRDDFSSTAAAFASRRDSTILSFILGKNSDRAAENKRYANTVSHIIALLS